MADLKFTYLPMPYVGLVAGREAVLKPILKGIKKERLLKLPLDEQHERLQGLWRLRATEAGKLGWPRAIRGDGLQYVRNCPPFGVFYKQAKERCRRCNSCRFCPNCYAREAVIKAYQAVEWAFYMQNNKPVVAYDFVVARRHWIINAPPAALFDVMREKRNLYRDKFTKPGGSITVLTLEPDREGWRIQLSTLVSANPEDMPDLGNADVKRLASGNITKRKLAMHVGWALRYPLGLMYGELARTVELFGAIAAAGKPYRQYAAAGGMKNQSMREMNFR